MGSVYKIVEIVGTSEKSWEDAARVAVETASKSIKELRIAEVNKLDIKVEKNGRLTFRTKLDISFKYKKQELLADIIKKNTNSQDLGAIVYSIINIDKKS